MGYAPTDVALMAMTSTEDMKVTHNKYITFTPPYMTDTGFILYPGANVEPISYAPLMRSLASYGHLSAIVKMPNNFATNAPYSADYVIDDHPEIKSWYLIGHSLGGLVACEYAYSIELAGLILLASYSQDRYNLSNSSLRVLSILGELDTVIHKERIYSKKNTLPSTTKYVEIKGGNHAQFGYYGHQQNDTNAFITTEEQHRITIKEILTFIHPNA